MEDCTQKSRKGDLLHINYTGTLLDGTVFDSSDGKKPLTFTLGAGQVIKGWDRGILGKHGKSSCEESFHYVFLLRNVRWRSTKAANSSRTWLWKQRRGKNSKELSLNIRS